MRKLTHKFKAKRTQALGRSYPSKLEASYAQKLEKLKESGEILFYLEQVPFRLPGNIIYRLDFMEFHTNGNIVLSETKGFITKDAAIKLKLFDETYGLEINLVRKI